MSLERTDGHLTISVSKLIKFMLVVKAMDMHGKYTVGPLWLDSRTTVRSVHPQFRQLEMASLGWQIDTDSLASFKVT